MFAKLKGPRAMAEGVEKETERVFTFLTVVLL